MTHSFKAGAIVTVINQNMGGRFFVEGDAVIVSPIKDVDEQYRVRFYGSKGAKPKAADPAYERFVDPAAQTDPVGFVSKLNGAA